MRRAFRILPAALAYLTTVAALSGFSVIHVSLREWLSSLLFLRNYPTVIGGADGWYTGHFWSLALEEQFYFLFPVLLVLFAKRYRLVLLSALAVLIALHRSISLHHRSWQHIQFHADTRLDSLLIPAIFAVLASNPNVRDRMSRILRFWPALAVIALCVIPYGIGSAWHITLLAYLMPAVVLGSVLHPMNVFGRALNWIGLRYIGRISYSLYLWQQAIFTQHFMSRSTLGVLQDWPMRLIMTFGCAIASYYLIEQPLMRYGKSLSLRVEAAPS